MGICNSNHKACDSSHGKSSNKQFKKEKIKKEFAKHQESHQDLYIDYPDQTKGNLKEDIVINKFSNIPVTLQDELFICPISQCIMQEPVSTRCGHTFEESCIRQWLSKNEHCPVCNKKISKDLVCNFTLKSIIQVEYAAYFNIQKNQQPKTPSWSEYSNIDMCGQGDVEIIPDWKKKYSIEDLKRIVEQKGYSAITVSSGKPSFGHAALKKFSFPLKKENCKPISTCCKHPCTIYIYNDAKPSAVGTRLVLVKRGSPRQAIFSDIGLLMEGGVASTRLDSHGNNGQLGKLFPEERRWHEWRYIHGQCVSNDSNQAIKLKYEDNNYLKVVGYDLVLDVEFWKMNEGTTVNYVGAGENRAKTKLGGGGRDWTLNNDGTISAKHHPHLVLGF